MVSDRQIIFALQVVRRAEDPAARERRGEQSKAGRKPHLSLPKPNRKGQKKKYWKRKKNPTQAAQRRITEGRQRSRQGRANGETNPSQQPPPPPPPPSPGWIWPPTQLTPDDRLVRRSYSSHRDHTLGLPCHGTGGLERNGTLAAEGGWHGVG